MADKKQNKRNNKNYDEDYNPRFRKQRKKVCLLGKILPRRNTGMCAKHQRDITVAIKRARHIALLPYAQK